MSYRGTRGSKVIALETDLPVYLLEGADLPAYLLEGVQGSLQDELGLTEGDLLVPLDTVGVKGHLCCVEVRPIL